MTVSSPPSSMATTCSGSLKMPVYLEILAWLTPSRLARLRWVNSLAARALGELQHGLVGAGLLQRAEVLAAVVLGEHGREPLGVAVVADLGGDLGQPGLAGGLQPAMAEDQPVAAVGLGGDDQVLEDADGPDGLGQLGEVDVPDGAAGVVRRGTSWSMGRYWTLGARLAMGLLLACGVSMDDRCGGPPAGWIAAAGQELGRWGHDGTPLLGQAPDGLPVPCRAVPGPRRRKGRPQGVPRDGSTGPSGSEGGTDRPCRGRGGTTLEDAKLP